MVTNREGHLCGYGPSITWLAVALSFVVVPRSSPAADVTASRLQSAAEKGYIPQEIELAAAGSWRSSLVLGVLARDGKGVAQDREAAYYHFQIAVLQGGEPAQDLLQPDLTHLSEKLTAEKLAEITIKADSWYQQHHLVLAFVYKDGDKSKQFPVFARAEATRWAHAAQLLPLPPG